MLNKIYKKIKDFIQKNYVEIIAIVILLFISKYPVNYYIITGGGTFDAKERVEIKDNYKQKGSLSFSYVSELKGTILTYLISYVVPSYERESIDSYKASDKESVEDVEFRSTLWLKNTNNIAIKNAYLKAGKEIKEKDVKYYVFNLTDEANTNINVGDEIISINNVKIDSFDSFRRVVKSLDENIKVDVRVKKNNKEYTKYAYTYKENNEVYIGVSVLEDVNYETDPEVKIKFKNSESGPSGGLILTLQIYNYLVNEDITHGYNIAGTGTIEEDGSVGEIDGVKYKISGAVKNKKEIFLVPSGRNYKEALKEKEKHNYNIKIISIDSFDDAIEKLSKLK